MLLGDEEVDRIAAFLGRPVVEFTERFTRLTANRRQLSLSEAAGGACVFLTRNGLCGIEPVKPAQCREFPWRWRFDGAESVCEALIHES